LKMAMLFEEKYSNEKDGQRYIRSLLLILLMGSNTFAQTNESQFASHPISFYLNHDKIPAICKDLYLKKIHLYKGDDNAVLGLMDSIFSKNKQTQPFYFLTLTRTMYEADGYYAEGMGVMAKSFVEKNSKEFVNYFIKESILTNKDFFEWAKCVEGEIEIGSEGKEQEELIELKKEMIKNCIGCGVGQKKKIEEFISSVDELLPSK
jgi:hypothetical protein